MRIAACLALVVSLSVIGCADTDVQTDNFSETVSAVVLDAAGSTYNVSLTYAPEALTLEQAQLLLSNVGISTSATPDIGVVDPGRDSPLGTFEVPKDDPSFDYYEYAFTVDVFSASLADQIDDRTWTWIDTELVLDLCPPGH